MRTENSSLGLDKAFHISLLIKAADSVLEIIGGFLVLFISPEKINHLAGQLTQHELSEDPHDFIATHILKASHDFAGSGKYFAAFYLLSHGIVKIILIVALFKEKIWAYPWMIVVLSGFIIYQIYRLGYGFSISLALLALFDIFIICLTWAEYKKRKSHLAQQSDG